MKRSFAEITANIEFLKKLKYKELKTFDRITGMYLVENNEITSCINVESFEEDKSLFLLSQECCNGYYKGLKIL